MTDKFQIKFKRTHHNAKLPEAKREGDIGYDLSCIEDFSLAPGQTLGVRTGLQVADVSPSIDGKAVFIKLESRSGLSLKGIHVLGGIIDTNYRGELVVILHNSNQHTFMIASNGAVYIDVNGGAWQNPIQFSIGDRVAQLLVYTVLGSVPGTPEVIFTETNDVTETTRGAGGLGSSGA